MICMSGAQWDLQLPVLWAIAAETSHRYPKQLLLQSNTAQLDRNEEIRREGGTHEQSPPLHAYRPGVYVHRDMHTCRWVVLAA